MPMDHNKVPRQSSLGPSLNQGGQSLRVLAPPNLWKVATEFCDWSHSSSTPTLLYPLETLNELTRSEQYVDLILISAAVPEEELSALMGRVSLMHRTAKTNLRLWCIDGSSPPEGLQSLHDQKRIRALSLLLGGVTLTVALREGQQAPPRGDQHLFSAPALIKLEEASRALSKPGRLHSFIWSELKEKTNEIERLSRWARVPFIIGLLTSIATLLALDGDGQQSLLIGIFVMAQLALGTGVIGTLWSFFEHRGIRQRVFLFWIDPTLR